MQQSSGPVALAYGYALTVDASQGATSDEHIDALPDGSRATHGLKGYVAESRHRDHVWLVVSEAAERKEVAARIPIGEYRPIRNDDVWKNVAANLSRQPIKASALEFLKQGAAIHRGTQMALPASLAHAEAREKAGQARVTIQRRLERIQAEMSPAIRQTIGHIQAVQQRILDRGHRQRPEYRGPSIRI